MKYFKASLAALVLIATLPLAAHAQQHAPEHAAAPRANEGKIPPAPAARTRPPANNGFVGGPAQNATTMRSDGERKVTGNINDTQHVNHDVWYSRPAPNDPRFKIAQPFAAGKFAKAGPENRFGIQRIDAGTHRFWFAGGGYFTVADWDWTNFADWCWNCGDDFVVYEDPDHIGWYLLYNSMTGAYIHVTYDGM
jgi:hypothetical protein